MLLVLDNCEHVIEAAAALAVDTLKGGRACGFWRPATSVTHRGRTRAPSVTSGEPSPARQLFAAEGSQLPRRLFVERAAATMNEFELTDADAAIVAEICENWTEFRLRSEFAAAREPVAEHNDMVKAIPPDRTVPMPGKMARSAARPPVRAARGCR